MSSKLLRILQYCYVFYPAVKQDEEAQEKLFQCHPNCSLHRTSSMCTHLEMNSPSLQTDCNY